jgi:hypothetical protein
MKEIIRTTTGEMDNEARFYVLSEVENGSNLLTNIGVVRVDSIQKMRLAIKRALECHYMEAVSVSQINIADILWSEYLTGFFRITHDGEKALIKIERTVLFD